MYVEGKLQTDSWDDKDTGEKKYRTKVRADQVQFLGGPSDGAGAERGASNAPPEPKPQDDFDDDIPF